MAFLLALGREAFVGDNSTRLYDFIPSDRIKLICVPIEYWQMRNNPPTGTIESFDQQ